jgi:crcB protein
MRRYIGEQPYVPNCVFARIVRLTERRTGLQKYLLIAAGGALGSIARYWVGSTVSGRMGIRFPYGTLLVNITACVIIGFSLTYLGRRADLSPAWRYLIPVGFVGAYSTFSTYEWETLTSLRAGAFFLAALYALGSLILGLVAVWWGSRLAEIL